MASSDLSESDAKSVLCSLKAVAAHLTSLEKLVMEKLDERFDKIEEENPLEQLMDIELKVLKLSRRNQLLRRRLGKPEPSEAFEEFWKNREGPLSKRTIDVGSFGEVLLQNRPDLAKGTREDQQRRGELKRLRDILFHRIKKYHEAPEAEKILVVMLDWGVDAVLAALRDEEFLKKKIKFARMYCKKR
ncbi:hypothetical protein L596_010144 [Steinernema carpocapsae]|uniref:Uncharacterized protein n=1 Tax=Steinernema carpocapsae TaxID=34508 RepID=A0A4U5PHN3_STECR|nr:hypothetical protein L596_010144 [Steinernema carpocapsae]